MHFVKMQGVGNDYVCIDCFHQKVQNPSKLAVQVSDRHTGIGSDGIILICPSDAAEAVCRMRMYNADGSEGGMCGNGLRMVAQYAYQHQLTSQNHMKIETADGLREAQIESIQGDTFLISVDMGEPKLASWQIPMQENIRIPQVLQYPVTVEMEAFSSFPTFCVLCTCVNMGNPHCVIFIKQDPDLLQLSEIGTALEHHPIFPERTNVEFVQVVDGETLKMRVWERGTGETLACGTGACAVLTAAVLNGFVQDQAMVICPGGNLFVTWNIKDNRHIMLKGLTSCVFEGELVERL